MDQRLSSSLKVTTERDLMSQAKLSCFQYPGGETEAQGAQRLVLGTGSGLALGACDIWQIVLKWGRDKY